uniref:Uncharacterized protein n=1 Tax=Anguilla anguilla TaxID=7936 RepID=A0A0E9R790_ANGAN
MSVEVNFKTKLIYTHLGVCHLHTFVAGWYF